ncbi:hypothetical protein Tco_1323201 [Tanacetum coccineum]
MKKVWVRMHPKKGRINAIDADEDITMFNVQDDVDNEMFDVNVLAGDEVFAEQEVAAKDVNLTVDEVTLAQALAALKSVNPKVKGDVIEEPNALVNAASASTKVSAATITTATIQTPRKGIVITEVGTPTITRSLQQPSQAEVQDKGKRKMIKPEPVKKMSKKDQLISNEEEAKRLQAKFDEQERLAREKDEANGQEELSVEEKEKLFQQLLEQRRKHFATKSEEEKRNKPLTQAQQRKIIRCLTERVNTFVNIRIDLVEGSSKRAREELEQESTKKQKVDKDKDTTELQSLMKVIPDEEEIVIDVVPLATKPPTIIDWKIHKEGKNNYF